MPRHGFGRGFKVSKEQIVALLVALRQFVRGDYDRELADQRRRLTEIATQLQGIAAAHCQLQDPGNECLPLLEITVDEQRLGRSALEVCRLLRAGSPPCYVGHAALRDGKLIINPLHLDDHAASELARRLREEMTSRK
jgi:D-glucosaminate-6-phosphate ammonia-lyase